jgi:hypothetical protein
MQDQFAMPNLIIELIDPASITVLGVVLTVSFGLSIGITHFMSWLRPPRNVARRPVQGVRRQAVLSGPQQTWRMAALRPALRHVWRHQSQQTVLADELPKGTAFLRLSSAVETGITQRQSAVATHRRAAIGIDVADYAIAQLRRDMAGMARPAAARVAYPAFSRPVNPSGSDAPTDSCWAA